MKLKSKILAAALGLSLLSTLVPQLTTAFAQGSLTPSGPPGATMVTLSQIEPRTPIPSAPYAITQPGSYYLTANLTVSTGDAIDINTNGVKLDLNGFTISSTDASDSGYGIFINSGLRNITIVNGFIQGGVTDNGNGVYSGSGFGYGIEYENLGSPPGNMLVSRVSVSGCLYDGIYLNLGDSTVVESCTVRTVGGYGIVASTVRASSALDCGSTAIYSSQASDCFGLCSSGTSDGVSADTAQNCNGQSNGNGFGVAANAAVNCFGFSAGAIGVSANTAQNCIGESNGSSHGVSADTAQNCFGGSITGDGVDAAYTAENCYGQSSSADGINTPIARDCYGTSSAGIGVNAIDTAENCYGQSSSSSGVNAPVAQSCYGSSTTGNGLVADTALNCFGTSNGSGWGVYCYWSASGCYGYSASGTGVYAYIASLCHGDTGTGTTLSTPHNVNSF